MNFAYRTILATTDLSDPSAEGLERAADLAVRLGSRLVVVYVADDRIPPMVLAVSSESEEEILERHVGTARKSLTEFVANRLEGLDAETLVLTGAPHLAIVQYAEEIGADLIVCATHGHGPIGHALMGSTTERVLHRAPCPVLVVRSGNHE
jgi:nucleotide-binding universal stress UspA family protein